MKKNLLFAFAALASMAVACSEKPDNTELNQDQPIVELYSPIDLWGGEGTGDGDIYFIHMAYDIPNDTIFRKRVDASFEMFKGKDLQFQVGGLNGNPVNTPVITNDRSEEYFSWLFEAEHEWSPIDNPGDIHDYKKQLDVVIPEEGDYEFRLKLYQVENDMTFYSHKYRLNVVKRYFEYDPDAPYHHYYYGNLVKID